MSSDSLLSSNIYKFQDNFVLLKEITHIKKKHEKTYNFSIKAGMCNEEIQ